MRYGAFRAFSDQPTELRERYLEFEDVPVGLEPECVLVRFIGKWVRHAHAPVPA